MDSYFSKDDVLEHKEMTVAEERAVFERFYAGDMAARDVLINNNLRYATSVALRLTKNRKRFQKDAISHAIYGLVRALESRQFKPQKGRFTTFATKWIIGEICSFFRVSCSVSFPAGQLPDWPENGIDPDVETFADAKSFNPTELDFNLLHGALSTLDEDERALMELLFFDDHSVSSASGVLGISRQWAHIMKTQAMRKLRTRLEGHVPFPETPPPFSPETETVCQAVAA